MRISRLFSCCVKSVINSADFFDFGVDFGLDLGVDFVDLVDFEVLLILHLI